MTATKNNRPDVVQILLANKADPTIKDTDRKTALDYAKEKNDHNMII